MQRNRFTFHVVLSIFVIVLKHQSDFHSYLAMAHKCVQAQNCTVKKENKNNERNKAKMGQREKYHLIR